MPLIESVFTTGTNPEQLVARVRLDRTELVMHGDIFPHFAGHQYRALGTMRLIDGPDGEWKSEHELARPSDTRLVEVVVRPVEAGTAHALARLSSERGKRRKSNGILPHEPFSGDKAAE